MHVVPRPFVAQWRPASHRVYVGDGATRAHCSNPLRPDVEAMTAWVCATVAGAAAAAVVVVVVAAVTRDGMWTGLPQAVITWRDGNWHRRRRLRPSHPACEGVVAWAVVAAVPFDAPQSDAPSVEALSPVMAVDYLHDSIQGEHVKGRQTK